MVKTKMPVERLVAGGIASSETPVMKKRKLSGAPLLNTPTRVLEQVKNVSSKIRKFFIHSLLLGVVGVNYLDL